MTARVNRGDSSITVGPVTNPAAVAVGEQIEGLFRLGCSYARLAKDGRHAWAMVLTPTEN